MSTSSRILLFLLIVSTIIGAGLWIVGGKKHEYSTSLTIEAAPENVFPYLTQPDHLKQWMTGLKDVKELSQEMDEDGTPRTVKTPRVISDADGNQTHYQDQVIRFEKGEYISVQSTNSQEVITRIYQLEPVEGKTNLSYRVKTESVGLGRFIAPFQTKVFDTQIEDEARQLKTLVEANEPAPEPVEPIYQNPNF